MHIQWKHGLTCASIASYCYAAINAAVRQDPTAGNHSFQFSSLSLAGEITCRRSRPGDSCEMSVLGADAASVSGTLLMSAGASAAEGPPSVNVKSSSPENRSSGNGALHHSEQSAVV